MPDKFFLVTLPALLCGGCREPAPAFFLQSKCLHGNMGSFRWVIAHTVLLIRGGVIERLRRSLFSMYNSPMAKNTEIYEFNNSDGLTPRQVLKLNANFKSLLSAISEMNVRIDALRYSVPYDNDMTADNAYEHLNTLSEFENSEDIMDDE